MSKYNPSKVIFYVKLPNHSGFMVWLLGNNKIHIVSLTKPEMDVFIQTKEQFENLRMEHEPIMESGYEITENQVSEIAAKYLLGEDLGELFSNFIDEFEEVRKIENEKVTGIDDYAELG